MTCPAVRAMRGAWLCALQSWQRRADARTLHPRICRSPGSSVAATSSPSAQRASQLAEEQVGGATRGVRPASDPTRIRRRFHRGPAILNIGNSPTSAGGSSPTTFSKDPRPRSLKFEPQSRAMESCARRGTWTESWICSQIRARSWCRAHPCSLAARRCSERSSRSVATPARSVDTNSTRSSSGANSPPARTHSSGTVINRKTGEARPASWRELSVLQQTGGRWKIASYMFQNTGG
jgi:hypothetical protein